MDPPSKHQKRKCVPAAKISRRKIHSPRSPLQDINNTSISCSSSNASIEAPRGCLRFLLSHSSSSSTKSDKPKKCLSKTPISTTHLKSKAGKENPSKRIVAPKFHRSKKNSPSCLYQKKPSSRNGLKSETWEQKAVTVVNHDPGESNLANCTPLSKFSTGSDLFCANDNSNSDSKTKTPPVQPSVSPEIQCGSSTLSRTISSACYGAGHVISGVADKRKCRPRGILIVGDSELSFNKANAFDSFDDDDDDSSNGIGIDNTYIVSPIPLPADASMHWLLSPCNEEDEDSEDGSHPAQTLADPATLCSPSSDACAISNMTSSVSNTSRRRRSASLVSPTGLLEFDHAPEFPHSTVSPSYKNVALQEEINGEISPLSACSLGSGNVMKTPQSDSSSDRHISLSWLYADNQRKNIFDSELSMAEAFKSVRLSPKSQVSMWDPNNSSFQFDCLTSHSNSVDHTHFHKGLDNRASWFSSSVSKSMSQTCMRISWREGLVSRIFEMDEFDCCRCLSDEEEDTNEFSNDKLESHSSSELNVDANKDHALPYGLGPAECINNEAGADGKGVDKSPSQLSGSCAESISIDGGDLAASGDLDWKLCYKNQLFKV